MTKAKTAKKAAESDRKPAKSPAAAKTAKAVAPKAKPAKAAKPAAKPAAKAAPKKTAIAAKPAAPKAKEPSGGKTAKIAKPAPAPAPKADKAAKAKPAPAPAEETKPRASSPTRSHEKAAIHKPVAPKPAAGFSNSGLGVKIASKKPALSVAPGVMILGRPAPAKTEAAAKTAERKLSKKELADITTFLIEKRERLLAGMRREFAMQRERADSKAADEVDKATDAYDEDLSFEIATANDQELEEIQVALEKIERGTYGECESCGTNISPSRLKILPSATTCVACRGQEEMARRRDDSPNFNMMAGEDGEMESNDM